MTYKILCVDDDENILAAYQRQLRKQFHIETALGGGTALQFLSKSEPYAVVISDLRMPVMDGIEFLAQVKQIAPNTVRMMLTGNADLHAAIEAVNQGNIFRFLTKPCSNETLVQALQAGLEQYRLIVAEKELLEQTLKGSVGVLTEILSIVDPQLFGRACILRDEVREIALSLNVHNLWDLELAAMLCEIGRVTMPASIITKEKEGASLTAAEMEMLASMPEIGRRLLANIPRLEPVARTVLYQNKNFDGSGYPLDAIAGDQIPLGSRIIKILNDLHQCESKGMDREEAFTALGSRLGIYDSGMLDWISEWLTNSKSRLKPVRKYIRFISIAELEIGQTILSDIITETGAMLIPAGNRISESLREKIRNFARLQGVREPIKVEIIESVDSAEVQI
jgi:response regulator RpfG family c-di-GMP phosphodiesterase